MTKIIIQGAGIVGQATNAFLNMASKELTLLYNDPPKDVHVSDEDWTTADWVVVCVPTDLNTEFANPENSTANVDAAINQALEKGFKGKFVIRSTMSVAAVKSYMEQLGQHLVVWPEYIREATWAEDAVTARYITLGGEGAEEFSNLLTEFKGSSFITDPMEAMLAKLSTNAFLAMKVIFANQVKQIADANGADYNIVKVLLQSEGRLGQSHWDVPGADGLPGFAGKCFPKDVKTFEADLIRSGSFVDMIRGVSDINTALRTKNGNTETE
jgi:UDP-glucose 6-dehydrogenase